MRSYPRHGCGSKHHVCLLTSRRDLTAERFPHLVSQVADSCIRRPEAPISGSILIRATITT
ncbi:hypothetical protein M430DRAFT_237581 [Amorphotheca resinae ATCC 22711]|uniref:Uncharacterized protein n=1 Tax=Amorphotheca resinae ATCC 22711 TaxID=857342 RepID=A0A2T3B143_AMORE|nr:hypothetical protein M430DRAFT_237581 [Amorphotheca resinae ATCC 22711]PSS18275.1 hypothetical protein M430DRAFT_237581 [Amorphotheca resinae ATCC 22711]